MKKKIPVTFGIALALVLILVAGSAHGAAVGTVEHLYETRSGPSVGIWVLIVLGSLLAAAIVVYSGGTGGPAVAYFGTLIGNAMGLSGIAATNAGLALLGGGAIASGGFGIVGGAAVLTVALTFSTSVVFDYGAGRLHDQYQRSEFIEASRTMLTLPLPRNTSGSRAYRNAMKTLSGIRINDNAPALDDAGLATVDEAIQALGGSTDRDRSDRGILHEESLLALLHFLKQDMASARSAATDATLAATRLDAPHSLASFIIATTMLYEDELDFDGAFALFREATAQESEAMHPLLFSVFMDRVMFRIDTGDLSARVLEDFHDMRTGNGLSETDAAIQLAILSRIVIRIKLEQQKIISLSVTNSESILSSPLTLPTLTEALTEYHDALHSADRMMNAQQTYLARAENEAAWWGKPSWVKNHREALEKLSVPLREYSDGALLLEHLVATFGSQHDTAQLRSDLEKSERQGKENEQRMRFYEGALVLLVGIGVAWLFFARRRQRRMLAGAQ